MNANEREWEEEGERMLTDAEVRDYLSGCSDEDPADVLLRQGVDGVHVWDGHWLVGREARVRRELECE